MHSIYGALLVSILLLPAIINNTIAHPLIPISFGSRGHLGSNFNQRNYPVYSVRQPLNNFSRKNRIETFQGKQKKNTRYYTDNEWRKVMYSHGYASILG